MNKLYFFTRLLLLPAFGLLSLCSGSQEFKLPPFDKFRLKNGLTVYLMEHHEVPLINVSVLVPAGSVYDDKQAGLASLTSSALKHGTKNYSKNRLDEELDFIGATVNTYAAKESAGFSAQFASKDKEKVLDILFELLAYPVFDSAEFNKEKKITLVQLEQARERPRAVIGAYFDILLYGDHPYGNITDGTLASVNGLSAADAKDFYLARYIPAGSAIAVVGDFNRKEMKAIISRKFSAWKNEKKQNREIRPPQIPAENKVLLVNKDDARETTFIIGSPGISRNNPDFLGVQVINTLFGGRFTSMLNDALRVSSGLTYGALSRFATQQQGGSFYIFTFTGTATTEEAIDKALEVLHNLHTGGVDEQTLLSAKNYVKGQFPPQYETSGELASLLTQMFLYGFDESFINGFRQNVDKITADRAREIIRLYFPRDKLRFVLIGKAEEIREIAKKYGPVNETDIRDDFKRPF